jgi:hypothetical protein
VTDDEKLPFWKTAPWPEHDPSRGAPSDLPPDPVPSHDAPGSLAALARSRIVCPPSRDPLASPRLQRIDYLQRLWADRRSRAYWAEVLGKGAALRDK